MRWIYWLMFKRLNDTFLIFLGFTFLVEEEQQQKRESHVKLDFFSFF